MRNLNIPRLEDINKDKYRKRRAERQKFYQMTDHGSESTRFYQSPAWRNLRRAYLSERPLCELSIIEHKVIEAEHVHHIVKFLD